jgi:hypothetical protein
MLGATADGLRQRGARKHAAATELEGRLAAFGYALDAFIIELEQVPRAGRRDELVSDWIERRMPTASYFFGWAARRTLGRQLYAVIAELQRTWNALCLAAPREVLAAAGGVFDVTSEFAKRPGDFDARMQAAREDFSAVARLAVDDRLPRRPRRWRRQGELPAPVRKRLAAAKSRDESADTA